MLDFAFTIGELKNYFRDGIERILYQREIPNLSQFMPEKRFWQLRSCFNYCYLDELEPASSDPLYRIRPIVSESLFWSRLTLTFKQLNLAREKMGAFVSPSSELSLDEKCNAARSKFARHLICYNKSKNTGMLALNGFSLRNTHFIILREISFQVLLVGWSGNEHHAEHKTTLQHHDNRATIRINRVRLRVERAQSRIWERWQDSPSSAWGSFIFCVYFHILIAQ